MQDGIIHVWDANTLKAARPSGLPAAGDACGHVHAMTVTPDGMRVFGWHASGVVYVWRPESTPADAGPAASEVAFSMEQTIPFEERVGAMNAPPAQLAWLGGTGGSLAGKRPPPGPKISTE